MAEDTKQPRFEDPNHVTETYADVLIAAELHSPFIQLVFGARRPALNKDDAATVEVSHRLILGPEAAVRLRQFLGNAIRVETVEPVAGEKPN